MRLIINATNLQRGGALQVASGLLEEWRRAYPQQEYHVFLSPQLDALVNRSHFPDNFTFYPFYSNPGKSVWSALTFHRRLSQLEARIKPDLVFTVFGPALWTPRSRHLCGFANGYYLFDQAAYIRERVTSAIFRRLYYYLRRTLLFRQLRREADAFWVETHEAAQALSRLCAAPVAVVGNTYSRCLVPDGKTERATVTNFLYLSAWYPHKNMELLPAVAQYLHERKWHCRIWVTLPGTVFDRLFAAKGPEGYIVNLGPVHADQLRAAYEQADAVLIPTLLETFSAAYPEAMRMERPILTSDLPFAREVCGNAALYFDPYRAEDIGAKMIQLMQDPQLYAALVQKGQERLTTMETPASRAARLMDLMLDMNLQNAPELCAE